MLGVIPEFVEVTAARVATEEFQVTIDADGAPPEDYELAGDPLTDPTFVTASGEADRIDLVATVEVEIDIAGLRATRAFENAPLVAKTASGSPLTGITLTPDRVTVTYPVQSKSTSKTVTIVPVRTGDPADGYVVTKMEFTPNSVAITGFQQFVESVDSLQTEPVNVEGAKSTITRRVALDLPENISTGDVEVSVVITIEALQSAAVRFVAPIFENLPEGLQIAAPAVFSIPVTLRGSIEDIIAISEEGLTITISLDGLEAGTHTIEPEFTLPEGLEADPIEAIEVTLEPTTAEEPV